MHALVQWKEYSCHQVYQIEKDLNTHHAESIIIAKESVVAVGRLFSLPRPAASSDSSIVYAGSRSCLHLLL
jgi:hypothetical protein